MLTTVAKAFQVLSLFTPTRPVWGATSVAAELGLKKSTAHDLLGSLAELGMLHRQGGQYTAGLKLLSLARSAEGTFPWLDATRREMVTLAAQTGEAIHLSTLQGYRLLDLEEVQGVGAVRVVFDSQMPPHCTAMGKVLLSDVPPEELARLTSNYTLRALTPNSITTADELHGELARVAEQGYAYDVEEVYEGVCCIAVPVRSERGKTLASISVSAPAFRFYKHKDELRSAVLAAGARLSSALSSPAPSTSAHSNSAHNSLTSNRT
ncbi:IclR family transcriptional regulator [Deinococcus detaillensis]|uniref:IclR family transcriptional regulator n=1 Tax=Deinococcus detaillensis TaxID=2592048 RepID=A0A553V5U7_9DEIO|nr:IclR family transcriptional regulator [Deinococcus detaillensis]TSA87601.1 IclR family transcriptional regulator [Deinococcus detaillensis]